MADTVRRVDYFSVTVPDAPGEGDRILSTLRDRSVNLLAYLGFPLEGGRSQLDLVPEDADALRQAAETAGLAPSPTRPRSSQRRTSTSGPPRRRVPDQGGTG